MRYPREVVDEVRLQNDIVEVISQYVPLKQKGSSYFGLCPFHNEKTASFSVNSEKQFYYCFGCGAAGNVFSFLMEMENCDFPEAMKRLAERAHITLPEPEKNAQAIAAEQLKKRLFEMHTLAGRFFYEALQEEEGAGKSLSAKTADGPPYGKKIRHRLRSGQLRCAFQAFAGEGLQGFGDFENRACAGK